MWYNYARFGSPLDFGIQYSLTINDFTHTQYQTFFVLIGLYHYLFAMPSVQVEYPFLTTPFSKLGVNGYYFSDSGNTSGILYLALPTFAYLLSGRVMRRLGSWKARLRAAVTVGLPCLVMPLVIIVSIWESGYAVRYTADFSWEIIMGALVILFYLYQKTKRCWKQQAVRYFLAVSMVAAVIVNGVQIFNFAFSYQNYAVLCSQFEQMVAFWR
jgi:hypothetical protein